ncbi:MAG: putative Fimbral protein [Candidatus Saccharibacteria bacterium]|nr:putative Fimbral protein [Candidatus Saccharibacteria bacterium]
MLTCFILRVNMWVKQKQTGFTIVELLIVIVVIGILAAITIVAFNGIQARANDTRMKSIASQLEKALYMWNADTNVLPKGGWSSTVAFNGINCADGTGGWIYKSAYTCGLEDLLLSKNYIPAGLITGAPNNKGYGTGTNGNRSFMFYPCSGNQFALYWSLESPSASDSASITAVEAAGCTAAPRVTYAMKAAKLITLN